MRFSFQRMLEKVSGFLFGDYAKNREELYEVLFSDDTVVPSSKKQPNTEEKSIVETLVSGKEKKVAFESSLQDGIALVYLDPRVRGVKVPEGLMGQDVLVLSYSYRYAVPDFDFDDERIVASLSFSGVPMKCIVPWDAVMGIVNKATGEVHSFMPPIDVQKMPARPEVKVQKEIEFNKASHNEALKRRSEFKVIKGGKS